MDDAGVDGAVGFEIDFTDGCPHLMPSMLVRVADFARVVPVVEQAGEEGEEHLVFVFDPYDFGGPVGVFGGVGVLAAVMSAVPMYFQVMRPLSSEAAMPILGAVDESDAAGPSGSWRVVHEPSFGFGVVGDDGIGGLAEDGVAEEGFGGEFSAGVGGDFCGWGV